MQVISPVYKYWTYSLTTLFFTLASLLVLVVSHPLPLDHWVPSPPSVTAPDAYTIWIIGTPVVVTWDTTLLNPWLNGGTVSIYLISTDTSSSITLMPNVPMLAGQTSFYVPNVIPGTYYVSVGSSDKSADFQIQ